MSVREFRVELCTRSDIKDFVEEWHYSRSINGLRYSYCFKLIDTDGTLIGAMIYGSLGMANCWKRYASSEDKIIELRRLCCIDNTPKNTESFFIGKTLRWLIKNTGIETVVSYADPEFNHEGTIYKASNFTLAGQTGAGNVILFEGRRYHDKCIRTKYKGELKPFARKIKQALEDGEATYQKTKPKNTYIYNLEEKRKLIHKRVDKHGLL